MTKGQRIYLPMVLLLLVFFRLATLWLDKPFAGHHDWDNVDVDNVVRNYLRDGYAESDFLNIRSRPDALPEHLYVYRSRPPTMGIYVSLLVRGMGDFPTTIRTALIFLSMISICVFYQLARRIYGRRIGWLAAFFFTFSPTVVYFSRIANWEQGSALFTCAFLLAYVCWLQDQRRWQLILAYVLAFLSIWWLHDMAFLLAVLFIYSLLMGTRRQQIHTFGMGLAGLFALILFFFVTTNGFDSEALDQLRNRAELKSGSQVEEILGSGVIKQFTIPDFIGRWLFRIQYGYSPFMLIFVLMGLSFLIRTRSLPREAYLVLAWLLAGFVSIVFWRNSSYLHDYIMLYIFAMPFALLAGVGLSRVWQHNSLIARNRVQRFAAGGVFGHLLLCLGAVIFLTNFTNRGMLWLAEQIAERTTQTEIVGLNIPYTGPHIEYYADRTLIFQAADTSENIIQRLEGGNYDLFISCRPAANPAPSLPASFQVEVLTADAEEWGRPTFCYVIRPIAAP